MQTFASLLTWESLIRSNSWGIFWHFQEQYGVCHKFEKLSVYIDLLLVLLQAPQTQKPFALSPQWHIGLHQEDSLMVEHFWVPEYWGNVKFAVIHEVLLYWLRVYLLLLVMSNLWLCFISRLSPLMVRGHLLVNHCKFGSQKHWSSHLLFQAALWLLLE